MSATQLQPGFLNLGPAAAREAVQRAEAAGRLQRTLLVHGPRGSGKGAFVDDLLALLLCADPSPARRPCNACRGCRGARARAHPDLVVGSPEGWREERSTGESIVGVARRWLLAAAGTPIAGDRRVVVIEGVDRANEQTQNVLLKALEEPGARQMFVLVADDLGRVQPTIVSRSQLLRIGAVPMDDLVAWLVDRERLPADQAGALARMADGLAGRAIGYARNPASVEWRRRIQAELLALMSRGPADRIGSMRELLSQPSPGVGQVPSAGGAEDEPATGDPSRAPLGATQRPQALAIADAWEALARDLLVASTGRPGIAPAGQLLPELAATARGVEPRALAEFVALLERVREGLLQNAAPRLALEVAALAWPTVPAAR